MRLSDFYYKSLPYRKRLSRLVHKVKPSEGPPLEMLVVASPRSGFALLIHVLKVLLTHKKWGHHPLRDELQAYHARVSPHLYDPIKKYLDGYYRREDVFVSGEFSSILGGPKWISKENTDLCCVRKYIGVKGVGDLTLVIFLPKYALEYYEVVHSHYSPALWINDSYYKDHMRFTSVRHPVDCITSAMFSLNALTSEYLQRYNVKEHMALREKLGLSKLSDLTFFKAIMEHYKDYFVEFLRVKDEYRIIRWEELIYSPEKTIKNIAELAEIDIGPDVPEKIWSFINFMNMLTKSRVVKLLDYIRPTYHKHNVWVGKKDHWKERLTNEHYEILMDSGFNNILEALGYETVKPKDEKDYTEFQKTLAQHLKSGKVYNGIEDKDLFMFAFNKSNIKSDAFDFISRPSTGRVQVERSSIKDERFLEGLEKCADEAIKTIWKGFEEIYAKHG